MHGLTHAVVRQPTFSPGAGEKVFLCLQPAGKLTSKKADRRPDCSILPACMCRLKLAACYLHLERP
jgi:hypothetical protein